MTDRGLYRKFEVRYADSGKPVDDAFVLRPEVDPAAKAALATYARTTDNRVLAGDLVDWLEDIDDG